MTSLFFFDLDGTLEDSRADMAAAVNRVRATFGLNSHATEFLFANVNRGMTELYLNCFADFVAQQSHLGNSVEITVEKVRQAYEADYASYVAVETKLYAGMKETLGHLAQLGKLVCVTNKPEKISWLLLHALGVGELFSIVMGGDSCPENKPSPLPLKIAAEKLGFSLQTGKAFMTGDSIADIKAGQAFGAKSIWCAWGYAKNPGSETPDAVANKPSDLPETIARLLK